MRRSFISSKTLLTSDARLQQASGAFGYASDRPSHAINSSQIEAIQRSYRALPYNPPGLITLASSAGQASAALTLRQPDGTALTISSTPMTVPVIQALDKKLDLSVGNYGAVSGESAVEIHDDLFSADPAMKNALRSWLVAVARGKVANFGGQKEFGTPVDHLGNPVTILIGGERWYPVLYTSATTSEANRLQFNIKLVSGSDVKKSLGYYIRFTHDESASSINNKIKHVKIGVSADTESYAKQQLLNQIQQATSLPSEVASSVTLEKFRRIGLLLANLTQSTEADHLSMAQKYNLDHGADPVTAQQISSMYVYIQNEYKRVIRQLFRSYFPIMFQAFTGMVEQAIERDGSLKSTTRPFFLAGQKTLTLNDLSQKTQIPIASTGDQTYPILVTMGNHHRTSYLINKFREIPVSGITGAYGCSATTIISGAPGKQVPVRLFGSYSIGLVLEPSRLTIPYAEFLAVGTNSIVPRTQIAAIDTGQKYANKEVATDYRKKNRGMNIAVCERHGGVINRYPTGSIDHIAYNIQRAVFSSSEKGGRTKWSRGVVPGTPMHYTEAIVLQQGDLNPCVALVYHLAHTHTDKQFVNAGSDIPYLKQTLRQYPHLCLVVYDYNLPNDIIRQLDNAAALIELDRMLACAKADKAYDTSALPIYRGYENLPVAPVAVSSIGDKARQFIQQIGLMQTLVLAHDDSRKALSYLWGGDESIIDYFGQTEPGKNPYDEAKEVFRSHIQTLPNLPDDMTANKINQIYNDTARALVISLMSRDDRYSDFISQYNALTDCLQLDSFMSADEYLASKNLMHSFIQASIANKAPTLPVTSQSLLRSRIWDKVKAQSSIDESQAITEADIISKMDEAVAKMHPVIQQLWSLCPDVKLSVASSSTSVGKSSALVAVKSMFSAAPAASAITITHDPTLRFSQRQKDSERQKTVYSLSGMSVDSSRADGIQIVTPEYEIILNTQLLPDQLSARVQEIANHSYVSEQGRCEQIIETAMKRIDLEENLNNLIQTDEYFTPNDAGVRFWYAIGDNGVEVGFSGFSQKRALSDKDYQITFDMSDEDSRIVSFQIFHKIKQTTIDDEKAKQLILFDMCTNIFRPYDSSSSPAVKLS